jgi:hypothetical protein
MNMVVGIEEVFSFCQMILRKMGLIEIQLFHPAQGMTYHDFQRMYGQKKQEETSFQNEIISCISDALNVYGQGLASEIFVAYIEDSERIDSVEFENSDYVAFKRELPKFLYLTYASFYSQKNQIQPKERKCIQGQIFDVTRKDTEVVFVLKDPASQNMFPLQTTNQEQLIQLLQGLGIHVPPLRPFEYLEDDFVLQMLYGREVCFCEYKNTAEEIVPLLQFFSSKEEALDGFDRVFSRREQGVLRDCAIKREKREFFNSLLSEDIMVHKKRTLGGLLEVYSYQYIATVVFATNQSKIGQIYGWFDDRGMHWKSDVSDNDIIPEMIRVLRNMDAEIGCQPQKPSRRNRRRR